jgi:ATP-dependent HslUV protease ATP-binding subunit HslU
MTDFSPREIVSELDRFIIGKGTDAKRAVARSTRRLDGIALLMVRDA